MKTKHKYKRLAARFSSRVFSSMVVQDYQNEDDPIGTTSFDGQYESGEEEKNEKM